ncbi:hypothetical protein GCM10007103_22890 [Salinimicrobium marinum]|uniref:Uncharacterized protein n=1 Tax=Salinimicrobium marinum TaxID=680283 RepID=A0A918W067_9FLAO|nr:hypothetical protein [Salinimicrobium marinum]GHA40954.1 hypothetical protein GCM10007103_22890 [Salinimicrobium marinum]
MKNSGTTVLFGVIFLLYGTTGFSQSSVRSAYESFDTAIHVQNTGLANGTEYVEQHIVKNNKHKYLDTPEYRTGTVVYDGQPYYNVDLKYNVYDDLLLVRIPTTGGTAAFELHKEKVNSFEINNSSFISVKENPENKSQFFEILIDGSHFLLLKKHLKKARKHLDQNFTYFEFEKDSPEYLLSFNGEYYEVNSRRSIRRLFPNQEEQIRDFYRSNSSLQKSDPDTFLTLLFKDLASSNSELKIK